MDFQYFVQWCQSQIGYGSKGYHLDKDILSVGNKCYSESTCCFVPREINNLLLRRNSTRGNYPIGVNRRHDKFIAQCNNGTGNKIYLGAYCTVIEAFEAYKLFKEQLMRQKAADYREQIDPRVYEALRYYSVCITD